ncbi:MAG: hypothetical protein ACI8PT_001342 [Gammaproteobacteria bacterium]|jgi:hypothetical protein
MSTLWYVRRGVQIKGPFKADVLTHFIAQGRVVDHDEVSRDRSQWQLLADARRIISDSGSQSEPSGAANPLDNPDSGASCDAGVAPSIDNEVLGDNSDERNALRVNGDVPDFETAPEHTSPPRPTRPLPRRPSVPRRPRVALPVTETPRDRVKQVTALASVMALIVIAGIAFLPPAELAGADCAAKPAQGVNWSNCRFENLDLTRAKLAKAILRSTRLNNVQAVGVQLSGADLAFAEMVGGNLAYADLESANAVGANFHNADLSYASLRGTDFSHADLSGANLGGTDLLGAKFDNAIWIDGRVCFEGSTGGCRLPK